MGPRSAATTSSHAARTSAGSGPAEAASTSATRCSTRHPPRSDDPTSEVFVPAHAEKLGRGPFHPWVRVPSRWTLVTDDSADSRLVDEFTARGAQVITVNPDQT